MADIPRATSDSRVTNVSGAAASVLATKRARRPSVGPHMFQRLPSIGEGLKLSNEELMIGTSTPSSRTSPRGTSPPQFMSSGHVSNRHHAKLGAQQLTSSLDVPALHHHHHGKHAATTAGTPHGGASGPSLGSGGALAQLHAMNVRRKSLAVSSFQSLTDTSHDESGTDLSTTSTPIRSRRNSLTTTSHIVRAMTSQRGPGGSTSRRGSTDPTMIGPDGEPLTSARFAAGMAEEEPRGGLSRTTLPATQIPSTYHVTISSHLRSSDWDDRYDVRNSGGQFHAVVFPALYPSAHEQVTYLKECLAKMVRQNDVRQGLHIGVSEEENIRVRLQLRDVYLVALNELNRQVTACFPPRGQLMAEMMDQTERLSREIVESYETQIIRLDAEIMAQRRDKAHAIASVAGSKLPGHGLTQEDRDVLTTIQGQLREWKQETENMKVVADEKYEQHMQVRKLAESWREKREEFDAEINNLRRQLEYERTLLLGEQDRSAEIVKQMMRKLKSQKRKITHLESRLRGLDTEPGAQGIFKSDPYLGSHEQGFLRDFARAHRVPTKDVGVQSGIDGEAVKRYYGRRIDKSSFEDSATPMATARGTPFRLDCRFADLLRDPTGAHGFGLTPVASPRSSLSGGVRDAAVQVHDVNWLVDNIMNIYLRMLARYYQDGKLVLPHTFGECVYGLLLNRPDSRSQVVARRLGLELVAALTAHRDSSPLVSSFAEFLEDHTERDVVSFYLYAFAVLCETPHGVHFPYNTMPTVDMEKAQSIARLLFRHFGVSTLIHATTRVEGLAMDLSARDTGPSEFGGEAVDMGAFLAALSTTFSQHMDGRRAVIEEHFLAADTDRDGMLNAVQLSAMLTSSGCVLPPRLEEAAARVAERDSELPTRPDEVPLLAHVPWFPDGVLWDLDEVYATAALASGPCVGVTLAGVMHALERSRLLVAPYELNEEELLGMTEGSGDGSEDGLQV